MSKQYILNEEYIREISAIVSENAYKLLSEAGEYSLANKVQDSVKQSIQHHIKKRGKN